MGYRQHDFAPDEWYHVFTRGIDKRQTYLDERDFQRFEKLLYIANDKNVRVNLQPLADLPFGKFFSLPRQQPLVAIGAYCLMGNHPHIVMQEVTEGGVSAFMHKVGTGYTSYFNRKYDRIGNLMVKPFRAKHIDDDVYLRRVIQYVHLNPAEMFEPGWKEGTVSDIKMLEQKLRTYAHSSLQDYFAIDTNSSRPQKAILDSYAYDILSNELPPLDAMIEEALAYYSELNDSFEPKPRGRPKKNKGVAFN